VALADISSDNFALSSSSDTDFVIGPTGNHWNNRGLVVFIKSSLVGIFRTQFDVGSGPPYSFNSSQGTPGNVVGLRAEDPAENTTDILLGGIVTDDLYKSVTYAGPGGLIIS